MYLYDTIKGKDAIKFCKVNLKMDPCEFDLKAINRIEIYSTEFRDPDSDYSELRVINCKEQIIGKWRAMGY